MAVSVITKPRGLNYVESDQFRTLAITGNFQNVEDAKAILLPYMTYPYLGTIILNVQASAGGRATFIISNSGGYSQALQISYYIGNKLRIFKLNNGTNWTVTDITGTDV